MQCIKVYKSLKVYFVGINSDVRVNCKKIIFNCPGFHRKNESCVPRKKYMDNYDKEEVLDCLLKIILVAIIQR